MCYWKAKLSAAETGGEVLHKFLQQYSSCINGFKGNTWRPGALEHDSSNPGGACPPLHSPSHSILPASKDCTQYAPEPAVVNGSLLEVAQ